MNSTKLFNSNFLMQNLKKSKGLLTLLVLIIPVLTVLLIASYNSSTYDVALEEGELAIINMVGMYIIPVIISVILSGYIYKRSSVDFINSMPMNRKTIFFTNFIGGVLIIFALQFLTLITTLVCTSIFTSIFIPAKMIFDCFVVMLISYIFVFSVSMLAQTVSGNVLTQIVVTAVILFLIPFIHAMLFRSGLYDGREIEISYAGGSLKTNEFSVINYTMPFRLVSSFFFSNSAFYNVNSMVRMVILSIAYLILGMILFEKRKMENVGTSFVSMKAHYIVKALTLVPMVFVGCLVATNKVYVGIIITLIFIYYILYDFIVSKKVKLKYTLIGFIASVVLWYGVYNGGTYIAEKITYNTIPISDIVGISISNTNMQNIPDRNSQLNILIEDSNIIEKICKNSHGREDFFSHQSEYLEYMKYEYVMARIKLTNGKDLYTYFYVNNDVYDEAIAYLKTKEEYKETFKYKDFMVAVDDVSIILEEASQIKEIFEENYYDLRYKGRGLGSENLTVYVYDNHTMKNVTADISSDEVIFDIITRNINKQAYDKIQSEAIDLTDEYNYIIANKYTLDTDNIYSSSNLTSEIQDDSEIINYIKNHYEDKCDMNKPFIIIRLYATIDSKFFVNVNDEIESILLKDGNKWYNGSDEKAYD